MKWIKLADTYTGPLGKAAEILEVEDAAADMMVKSTLATATDKPKEIDAAEKEIGDAIQKRINDSVETGINSAVDRLVKELKPGGKSGNRPNISTHDNAEDDPTFGFKNIGEQVHFIRKWYGGDESARKDERMKRLVDLSTKAPTTYANEGLGADGGFTLAPNFSTQVLGHTLESDSLLNRTDNYTTASNSLSVPKDETTPWGTAGVQCAWRSEAAQLAQSKPKFGQDNLVLHAISALVPVTDEQLQDSFVGLGQYVTRQAGERIMWKCDDAIVNGTGAGQPLGFFNSGAIVSQAKVTAQTAATINITNIGKMIGRCTDPTRAVWLVHPAAFADLYTLTNGNTSLYIPSGGVSGVSAKMGSLSGIPLLISQHCPSTLGTQGDIFLADLSKYLTLTKGDGIRSDVSMHLYFDYNVSAFRFNFRMAGQPWLQTSITSAYGSFTQSPFVTLDTRS